MRRIARPVGSLSCVKAWLVITRCCYRFQVARTHTDLIKLSTYFARCIAAAFKSSKFSAESRLQTGMCRMEFDTIYVPAACGVVMGGAFLQEVLALHYLF